MAISKVDGSMTTIAIDPDKRRELAKKLRHLLESRFHDLNLPPPISVLIRQSFSRLTDDNLLDICGHVMALATQMGLIAREVLHGGEYHAYGTCYVCHRPVGANENACEEHL